MRIHGTDQSKRLFCKFCGKGFWYEHNLQRHIKVIHGPHEENFHCSYCGKGFNMKSAMVTHVQQVHFNIFPTDYRNMAVQSHYAQLGCDFSNFEHFCIIFHI
jgi:hypothetical protein